MALQFSVNNTPATGAVAAFNLSAWLIAQGWIVPSASDGTTYLSTGNQITSGNAGARGLGNTNAWQIWQMPGTSKQISVQRGTTNQLWRVKYSPSLGFVTGIPGATQTPSAADEKIILGGGTDAAPTFGTLFGGADGSYRHNIAADVASPYGFFSFAFPISSSIIDNCNHSFIFDPILPGTAFTTDTDLYVISASGNTHSLGSGSASQGWFGLVNGTMQAVQPIIWPSSVSSGAWATDPVTGFDQCLTVAYYAPGINQKGQSSLMVWNTAGGRITPTTMTLVTVNDAVEVGTMLLPWNGGGITI